MKRVGVHRLPTDGPDDVSRLEDLLRAGAFRPEQVRAVVGKTEGNGCVNDFTRGFALRALDDALAHLPSGGSGAGHAHVACVMSGGTEGVMSPHLTVFTEEEAPPGSPPPAGKVLSLGTAATPPIAPEDLGRLPMVLATADAVRSAMAAARLSGPEDVHFVQLKCPLLTTLRVAEAAARDKTVVTADTYRSMAYSRAAAALGVALALGEVDAGDLTDATVLGDTTRFSSVASASAGVELDDVEVLVLGNSAEAVGDLVIGHAVMSDAIDAGAVRTALRSVGIAVEDGEVVPSDRERVVNVFAKAEADPSGRVRGRRHTMLVDSDIHSTRHARAVVSAVVASVVGDPMVYVSGGAEHQGPPGGGPVAVIARRPGP